jgi:hypothetical protein
MAKHLTEFTLDDGTAVFVETPNDVRGDRRFANECLVTKAKQSFETVVARIRPAADAMLKSLRELNTPQEIELEFGIALSADAGVVFVSAESEVNFKVRLKWENGKREPR